MSQQWYYAVDGNRQGPVSAEQLKRLAASGQLQPTDLVWKDGLAEWAKASSVKGLFAEPPKVAPAPPPIPEGAIPVERNNTGVNAPVTHNGRIETALADLQSRGVGRFTAAPPAWRLAWKLGVELPPPHFMTFGSLALGTGLGFSLLWGIAEYVLRHGAHDSPLDVVITSVIAGCIFGLGIAAYYRNSARKLAIPLWNQFHAGLPNSATEQVSSRTPLPPTETAGSVWREPWVKRLAIGAVLLVVIAVIAFFPWFRGTGTITFAERVDSKTLQTTHEGTMFTTGWVHMIVRGKRPFKASKLVIYHRPHGGKVWSVLRENTISPEWDVYTGPLLLAEPGDYEIRAATPDGDTIAEGLVHVKAK